MTWVDRLVEVNRQGDRKLVIAHLHPGEVATSFQRSLMNTFTVDRERFGRLLDGERNGLISTHAGAGVLAQARNDAVKAFLARPGADLLLFIDSDMGWNPEAPEMLARALEAHDLDIVGGLCFGQRVTGEGPQRSAATEWFPTIYRWDTGLGGYDTAFDYPPDTVIEVGATGGAFLLITRRCLESIGSDWFTPVQPPGSHRPLGEDMSFCWTAREHGFLTHVHTGVRVSHRKDTWITESDYLDARHPAASAVTVVIPVKDNLKMTRDLVGQLYGQGGYTDLLIFDNGSEDPEMVEWLAGQEIADVYHAPDANLHEMWNAGIDEALTRHHGLADVVLLNNDLRVGPRFLQRLTRGLRTSGAQAVCGNYDGRSGTGVQPVSGICANRYDGTGGLAGFAFALSAEWVASGYRFPTDLDFYFGDNDLCMSIEAAGGWYGLVSDAPVTHLDGGSQTAGAAVGPSFEQDRKAFQARWPDVQLVSA